ncbi:NmrA/HSCARG family protein [Burkholderia aenigmatica]|uniref:NmrA family protein n=1 Tax=Burkholderia aenigmatica TaxID=2015348 RepID=A0A228I283_9BURK|nr:NmrA/HSCARG family protein [Burkholderia aenigmatica]MDN7874496.1 NmrA/HSCARG family protein [Burkholderia aenigmatica]OXI36496.1 NmrA family protein [Burkholderia aenigmatica]
MTKKTIAVLGGTGQQGGAVIRALLADGRWQVRAISRNAESEASRALAARNVQVLAADLDNPASLGQAFAGVHGVFSVQGSDGGGELEARRGIAVADVALAAGVEHLVYASVGGADRQSRVPHFDSKWRVEEHIRQIGIPATIVRPVFFMDNFSKSSMRTVLMALLRSYVPTDKPLQMIATADIGKWVAHAFAHPDAFIGKAEEIAGDELTRAQITAAFKRHGWSTGLPFPIPRLLLRLLPYDARRMFEWFGEAGYKADIRALKASQTDLLSLNEWLAEQA